LDNRKIILDPARVGGPRERAVGDVIEQIASSKMYLEKMTPMVIVVFW
jgi:hypothetical protein